MKTKTIVEDYLLDKITEFIIECDSDELIRIADEIFGGKFTLLYENIADGEVYSFEPHPLNYWGAFGEIKDA